MNLEKSFAWMSLEERHCVIRALNRILLFPVPMRVVYNTGIVRIMIYHAIRKEEVLLFGVDQRLHTPKDLLEYMCQLSFIGAQFLSPTMRLQLQYEEAFRAQFPTADKENAVKLIAKKECPVCYELIYQGYVSICHHEVCVSCWRNMERCPLCRNAYFLADEENSDEEEGIL